MELPDPRAGERGGSGRPTAASHIQARRCVTTYYPTLSCDIPGEAGSPTGDDIDCVQTVGPSSEAHPHAPSMPRATGAISQRSQDPGTHRGRGGRGAQ